MYKLLPILLFAFLIADESIIYLNTEGWQKSNKLKDEKFLEQINIASSQIDKKIGKLLNPEKFEIDIGFKVIDTKSNKMEANDSNLKKIQELDHNVSKNFELTKSLEDGRMREKLYYTFYRLSDDGLYYEFRATMLGIVINVDNSIELGDELKKMLWNTVEIMFGIHIESAPDFLIFNSVDINKYKNNNKQLSLNRDDIYDDSWAVIIGIDKYENLSNLDYAVADAEAVKDMLINKFDYKEENVNLLLNEEANKTNIVNVISDVSLKAGENDRILVFYAGHGETMPLPEGGEMGYLIPIDGNQENLFGSAIPMDDLKDLSNMSKAKHMLFLVDACYGGLAAVGSRGLEPSKTPNYIEKISKIKSRQIITAGGKDEKVFEKSEWGHSAYTKNLLRALEDGIADSNGDGYITADELGDYLSEKVSIDSENQQTPQSRRLTSHEGEFIFIANKMEITINNESSVSKHKKNLNIPYMETGHSFTDKYILLPDGIGILMGFPGVLNIPIEYIISENKNIFIGVKPGYYPDSFTNSKNYVVSSEIYIGRNITKFSSIRLLLGSKSYSSPKNNINYSYAGISLNTWPGNIMSSAISINFINMDIGLIFSEYSNIFGGPQIIASFGYKSNVFKK